MPLVKSIIVIGHKWCLKKEIEKCFWIQNGHIHMNKLGCRLYIKKQLRETLNHQFYWQHLQNMIDLNITQVMKEEKTNK